MATETGSGPLRCFVAVGLPAETKSWLWGMTSKIRSVHRDLKWVAPENYHVTLLFLGDIQRETISGLKKLLKQAVSGFGPFEASIGAPGCFPARGAPRVLYAGIDAGRKELVSLAGRVREALAAAGFSDDKPFQAHVTVARSSRRAAASSLTPFTWTSSFDEESGGRRDAGDRRFGVAEVLLMRSVLRPEGPVYSVLERFTLGG